MFACAGCERKQKGSSNVLHQLAVDPQEATRAEYAHKRSRSSGRSIQTQSCVMHTNRTVHTYMTGTAT